MRTRCRPSRMPGRGLVLGLLLAVGTTLALPGAVHAGTNSAEGTCLKAFNHADASRNYLFASTEATGDCQTVHVSIFTNGTISGGPAFEGSECSGTYLEVSNGHFYTSTSALVDSSGWNEPCSQHAASLEIRPWHSSGGLWFDT